MKAFMQRRWRPAVWAILFLIVGCSSSDEVALLTRNFSGQMTPSTEWESTMRALAVDRADSLRLQAWQTQRTLPSDSFSIWIKNNYWPLQSLALRLAEQSLLLGSVKRHAQAQTQFDKAQLLAADFAHTLGDSLLLAFSSFISQLDSTSRTSRALMTVQRFLARDLLVHGKFQEAGSAFEKLRAAALRLQDPILELYAKLGELDAWSQQDRADTVIVLGNALAQAAQRQKFVWMQAQTLNLVADAHRALDHDALALQNAEQALALAQHLADRLTQRDAHFYRARILYRMDRLHEAEAALREMQQADWEGEFEAEAWFLEGQMQLESGEYGLAHSSFEKAAERFASLGQFANVAAAYSNSSLLHVENGEYQRALADERRAFDWHAREHSQSRMARSHMNLGFIHARMDSLTKAQAAYHAALKLFAQSKEARGSLETYLLQGELFLKHGRWHDAEQNFLLAAREAQPLGFVLGHARACLKLAELAVQQSRFAAADSLLRMTEMISANLNSPLLQAEAQWQRAQLAKRQAQPRLALAHLENAMTLQEKMFGSLTRDSLRVSFFATVQDYFDEAVSLAFALEESERALHYAERGRSRALLEAWGEEYADSTQGLLGATPSLAEIQKSLRPHARVLVYRVLPETTVLWLLSRDKMLTQRLPITGAALHDSTQKYLRSLGAIDFEAFRKRVNADAKAVYEENREWGRKFYELLLAPIAAELKSEHELYVIADGVLQQVPFGALVSARGLFVEEENTVMKTPSLTVLYRGLRQPIRTAPLSTNRLLYVGNPAGDLPAASSEMKNVTAHFTKKTVLLQHLARFDTIQTSLHEGAEIVHLSLHAVADPTRALNSYVELSRPEATATHPSTEKIYARRLLEWEMKNTWLVLLNGCETGTGQVVRGEGVLHLARLFAVQRVALVVASLWKNDDRWSAALVTEFYRQLAAGAAPQAALHAAKLETIKNLTNAPLLKYPLPYFWAVLELYLNRAVAQTNS